MAKFEALFVRLEGAYAASTIAGYRHDFLDFAAWARRRRLSALPAQPETVATYIDAKIETLTPASVRHRLVAIGKLHALAGMPSPTKSETVVLAMRRARRSKPARPNQALGITAERRDELMMVCTDDLSGLRDKVMLAVGFDSLCRRSELVALRVEDFSLEPNGCYTVLVRRAKNDQFGEGRIARLSRTTSELVQTWLDRTAAVSGPLIRPVYGRTGCSRYLDPSFVGATLKRLSAKAGYPENEVKAVSGHSLRVGAAQTLTVMGYGLLPIMAAGGWRSSAIVARYVEKVELNVWEQPSR
jgi:integrase/recombinase XerD